MRHLIILSIFLTLVFSLFSVQSCKNGAQRERRSEPVLPDSVRSLSADAVILRTPGAGERFRPSEPIKMTWEQWAGGPVIDSVKIFMDATLITSVPFSDGEYTATGDGWATGRHMLKALFRDTAGAILSKSVMVMILSDIVPVSYSYRIISSFPHDPEAYTQGLIYDDGFIYESTGQYRHSSLRKVKPETGEVIGTLSLGDEYFGEGIAAWQDKIIQLTWTSRVGFVYDKTTFRLINKIHYSTQGWGLTTDSTHLIMSDGSDIIYFLEPELFTEVKRVEVFDNEGPVENLNELEYINGQIFANVYQTDDIVIIDPASGKVTGRIRLKGLLQKRYWHDRLDVLNGIAYDAAGDRLFVTGKMWPLLFEIDLVPLTR